MVIPQLSVRRGIIEVAVEGDAHRILGARKWREKGKGKRGGGEEEEEEEPS